MTASRILGATPAGNSIGLDLDRLVGSHACIVANSGGGKSGLIRRMLEATHDDIQHIILDIEDEFYTLRERYDYVIAGGDGGDAPATVENAAGLARMALTHGFSLIVQLNDLGSDAPAFVARFLESMISAPRELWRPVLVIIDEAQRFVPSGAGTEATVPVKDLLYRGRKRGFTGVLASLRISEIDPGVRGMCNNWILGRVGQALDRNTMAQQLGFSPKEGRDQLRAMQPRSFWGFGPAISDEPVMFRVADVETTPVRPGQAKVATPPPPEALRVILQGLAQTVVIAPPAEQETGASKQIARLEHDNKALKADRDHWRATSYEQDQQLSAIREIVSHHHANIEVPAQGGGCPEVDEGQTSRDGLNPPSPGSAERQGERPRGKPQVVTAGETALNPTAVAIANLLDRINPARVTWGQAAAMVERKASGGNFNSARKALRESGRIVEDADLIQSAEPQPQGMERSLAIALWSDVLSSTAPKMIAALDRGPLSKEDLGLAIGALPRGGNFNHGLAQLRRNGVTVERGGLIALASPLPGEAK